MRVRLELGRTESAGSEPQVIVQKDCVVGFSNNKFGSDPADGMSNEDFFRQFSAEKGVMYVTNSQNQHREALKGPADGAPTANDNVYDVRADAQGDWFHQPEKFDVHFGNPVSTKITLPNGISPEALSLIANDAMLTGRGYAFSGVNASSTADELATAVQTRVDEILGSSGTPDIMKALQVQMESMGKPSISSSSTAVDSKIEAFDQIASKINAEINSGIMVPDQNIEDQFQVLRNKVAEARTALASSEGPVQLQSAIDAVDTAATSFQNYVDSVSQLQGDQIEDQISEAREAMSQAKSELEACRSDIEPYDTLSQSSTIEEYNKEIGISDELEITPEI